MQGKSFQFANVSGVHVYTKPEAVQYRKDIQNNVVKALGLADLNGTIIPPHSIITIIHVSAMKFGKM